MGQLNSNDIPPNPFVHGWNEPDLPPTLQSRRTVAREVPSAAGTPLTPQRTHAVSPLQRAHEIVSQPLPPARRPASSAWPMGFVFAAILIVASLILFAAVPHSQFSHLQTPATTNQVAANSRYSGSPASATPVSTPPVPVITQNLNAAQTDSGRIDQPPYQTQIPISISPPSVSQTPVPVQAQPPQNDIPAPPVQSPPVLPAVIVTTSTAQADSRPLEVAGSSVTLVPQTPVRIQIQQPEKNVSTFPVQRSTGSIDNKGASYSEINIATSSRSPRPAVHVFRTVGNVISWPVVHVLRTVGSVLPPQQPTRYIYIPAQATTPMPIARTSAPITHENPAWPENVRYVSAPPMNGSQIRHIVYPQQQSFQMNPSKVYYNQSPPMPVPTYQPGYQQRTYYGSQFAPQVRIVPNYSSYRPPTMMNVPSQQRRMR